VPEVWIQLLAVGLLLALVWRVVGFATGLRGAKRTRERARAEEESRGGIVVAEVPLSDTDVVFLVDDREELRWGRHRVRKDEVAGARLIVNGAVLQEFAVATALPPRSGPPEEYEGRERWVVEVFRRDGAPLAIPCGSMREGVSREIAGRVFAAVKAAARRL
jgi:hypothetical protein